MRLWLLIWGRISPCHMECPGVGLENAPLTTCTECTPPCVWVDLLFWKALCKVPLLHLKEEASKVSSKESDLSSPPSHLNMMLSIFAADTAPNCVDGKNCQQNCNCYIRTHGSVENGIIMSKLIEHWSTISSLSWSLLWELKTGLRKHNAVIVRAISAAFRLLFSASYSSTTTAPDIHDAHFKSCSDKMFSPQTFWILTGAP